MRFEMRKRVSARAVVALRKAIRRIAIAKDIEDEDVSLTAAFERRA